MAFKPFRCSPDSSSHVAHAKLPGGVLMAKVRCWFVNRPALISFNNRGEVHVDGEPAIAWTARTGGRSIDGRGQWV